MHRSSETTLPTEVSAFLGRAAELDELKAAVTDNRLVVLTGGPGVGKSRLALHLAAIVQRSHRDGCRLIGIDESADAASLTATIHALLPGDGDEWHGLVLLDGAERATDAVGDALEALLRAHGDLRILVTSRTRLGLTGERVLQLAPLSSPAGDLHRRQGPQAALTSDAVNLLVERAAATQPGFAATAQNVDTLLALCQAVDGIPSAIEAIARALRVFNPDRLLAELGDGIDVLDEFPGRDPRTPTMRAGFDAIAAACTPEERALWRRLSVFPGAFDVDAAVAVAGDDAGSPARVGALLASLADRSAVAPEGGTGTAFRMLAPTRLFAMRELAASGEIDAVAARFDHYLVGVLASAASDWFTHRQSTWAGLLARHHIEIFELLERYSRDPATARTAMTLICDLRFYWQWRTTGPETRPRDWLDAAFHADPTEDALRMRALQVDSYIALFENDIAGAQEQLAAARELAVRLDLEDDGFATFIGGIIDLSNGRLAEAEAEFERALDAALVRGKRASLGELYWYLALLRLLNGRFDEAERLCAESRAISTETGDNWGNAYTLWMIALMTLRRGDNERALNLVRQSIAVMDAFEDRSGVALCVRLMASIATSRGDYEQAAKLIGSIDDSSVIPELSISEITPELAGRVRSELGEGLFDRLFGSSASLSPSEAIAYALEPENPFGARPADPVVSLLTARESEIAELVAAGYGNSDIAATLFISRRTVEGHVQRILAKLEFRSRAQIASWVTGNHARDAIAASN